MNAPHLPLGPDFSFELAKTMSIHHSTASNMLNKLAKKGLIVRERIHPDQRIVTVKLTEEGMALIQQAPETPQGILQNAIFALPDGVLASLSANLDILVKAMAIQDREAAMQPLNPLPKHPKPRKKKDPS